MYYLILLKPFLSLGIAISAIIGYYISIHNNSQFSTHNSQFLLFAGVFLLSAGASALNQYLERDTDKLMKRTATRPLPAGYISPKKALFIIISLFIAGSVILYKLSIYAMLLGLLNIVLYDFIYTPMKHKTHLALLAGGLVGAVPPLIGWFAAGETHFAPAIICFAGFMFFWQIPHFIILNLKYSSDYHNAGIPAIANILSNDKLKRILLAWFLGTTLISMAFPLMNVITSRIQFIILIALNLSAIVLFSKSVFSDKKFELKIINILVFSYLFTIFLLISL